MTSATNPLPPTRADKYTFDNPDFLDSFTTWLNELYETEQPDLIVAIARGAVRLIQIAWQDRADTPAVVSHFAVPFLSTELAGKSVLIVDDSVIFGSTLSKIYKHLQPLAKRVTCAAFTVDRQNFFGETSHANPDAFRSQFAELPLNWKSSLWPDRVRIHHAAIVRNVSRNSMDYNLDFATVELRLEALADQELPYFVRLLEAGTAVREASDVTSHWSASAGIFRYTLHLNDIQPEVDESGLVSLTSCPKIRLVIDPSRGIVLVTPIVQVSMPETVTFEQITFKDTALRAIWSELDPPHDGRYPTYPISLLRLITVCISARLAHEFVEQTKHVIASEFPINSARLSLHDTASTIGPLNARAIERNFQHSRFPGWIIEQPARVDRPRLSHSVSDRVRSFIEHDTVSCLRPSNTEPAYEVVGKLFLILRDVTDSPPQRRENPEESRLAVGLTPDDIDSILCDAGITLRPDELSTALDICVDNGLAVPRFVQENGLCFRAFFSGEDEDDQATLQFKKALHDAYEKHLEVREDRYLTPFDLKKLCAFTAEIHSWIPVNARFHNFGRVSDIVVHRDDGSIGKFDLVKWITGKNHGALTKVRMGVAISDPSQDKSNDTAQKKNVLLLRDGFAPEVNRTLDDHDAWALSTTLSHAIRLFTNGSVTRDAKLLLSTCPTHRHTYNAIAFEIDAWVNDPRRNFVGVIDTLIEESTRKELSEEALDRLYWCVEYVSETHKKYEIFHKHFDTLRSQIERHAVLKTEPSLTRWWELKGQNLLDKSLDAEVTQRLEPTLVLRDFMQYLTAVTMECLAFAGQGDLIKRAFKNRSTDLGLSCYNWTREKSFNRFNNAATHSTWQIPKLEGCTVHSLLDTKPFLEQCLESAKAIADVTRRYVRKYETAKKRGFAFLPKVDRRTRVGGDREVLRRNQFVVAIADRAGQGLLDDLRECEAGTALPELFVSTKGGGQPGTWAFACTPSVDILRELAAILRDRGADLSTMAISVGDVLAISRGTETQWLAGC